MATTDLPRDVLSACYAGWRDAFVAGDPRRERAALQAAFDDRAFRWTWFEESFDWIDRTVAPEFGWPYLLRTIGRKRFLAPGAALKLLAGELGRMSYQARDRERWARLREHKRSTLVLEIVLIGGLGSSAEDAVARRFASRFAAGDGTAWPPYFPGDRTTLTTDFFQGRHGKSDNEFARCPARIIEPLWPMSPAAPYPAFPKSQNPAR